MKHILHIPLLCIVLQATRLFGQTADEGKAIAEKLLAKYPKLKQSVLSGNVHPKPDGFEVDGSATTYPVAGFILPIAEWNALTKPQKVSLTLYVESRIAFIRQHPENYVTTHTERQLNAIKHIANDAWYIGTATEDRGELYLDRKLVEGDGAWERDYAKNATKASEFRK